MKTKGKCTKKKKLFGIKYVWQKNLLISTKNTLVLLENLNKKKKCLKKYFSSGQMKELYSILLKTAIFILQPGDFKEEKAQLYALPRKWFQVQRAPKIYITQLLIYFL